MGRFADLSGTSTSSNYQSEVRCGQFLAPLLPAKWVIALLPPSGHRGAYGGSGSTADFTVYSGGADQPDSELINETRVMTIDAYTPERGTAPAGIAKAVVDKLGTQATAVIVDLTNFGNSDTRRGVIDKVISEVAKYRPGQMVVFLYNDGSQIYNPVGPFKH